MGKKTNEQNGAQVDLKGYVVVVSVDDFEEANEYRSLLEVNDIEAIIVEGTEVSSPSAVVVMVPEDVADEAHVVIESQDAYDDFYDMALDEDEGEFGDDFFDDEL